MRHMHLAAVVVVLATTVASSQTRPADSETASTQPASTSRVALGHGVAAHRGIDGVYEKFADAYIALDATQVASLYAVDATYLAPNRPIVRGRDQVEVSFAGTFDRARTNGQSLAIRFEVLDRRVDGNLAYDIGIYTLDRRKAGAVVRTSKGKYVVVAVADKTGTWRFQVDSYSGLKPPPKK